MVILARYRVRNKTNVARAEWTGHKSWFQDFGSYSKWNRETLDLNKIVGIQKILITQMHYLFNANRMLNTLFKEDFDCNLRKLIFIETWTELGARRETTSSLRSQNIDVTPGDDSVQWELELWKESDWSCICRRMPSVLLEFQLIWKGGVKKIPISFFCY